jgi:hypothetical protein
MTGNNAWVIAGVMERTPRSRTNKLLKWRPESGVIWLYRSQVGIWTDQDILYLPILDEDNMSITTCRMIRTIWAAAYKAGIAFSYGKPDYTSSVYTAGNGRRNDNWRMMTYSCFDIIIPSQPFAIGQDVMTRKELIFPLSEEPVAAHTRFTIERIDEEFGTIAVGWKGKQIWLAYTRVHAS